MSKPRVGFLGVGWIGRHRMEAMLATGAIEAAAICDASTETAAEAAALAPGAAVVADLEAMLDLGLDGVVIATPSALHAEQAVAALDRGCAVFCQKPLGRDAGEARAVVEAARRADRLLGVDFSYRFAGGMGAIRELIRSEGIGRVYAADLVFHNAYGPDKPWFYDPALSGGGCVIDLGCHLVDLALWVLDFPTVADVSSTLFAGGAPLAGRRDVVEDYAIACIDMQGDVSARLACSWRLPVGREAAISATFYGTRGGAALRNLNGSFHAFEAVRFDGTSTDVLCGPEEGWNGRAAADWAVRLAGRERFGAEAERLVDVAAVIDRIYAG